MLCKESLDLGKVDAGGGGEFGGWVWGMRGA
jgi:hypothetical protein